MMAGVPDARFDAVLISFWIKMVCQVIAVAGISQTLKTE